MLSAPNMMQEIVWINRSGQERSCKVKLFMKKQADKYSAKATFSHPKTKDHSKRGIGSEYKLQSTVCHHECAPSHLILEAQHQARLVLRWEDMKSQATLKPSGTVSLEFWNVLGPVTHEQEFYNLYLRLFTPRKQKYFLVLQVYRWRGLFTQD